MHIETETSIAALTARLRVVDRVLAGLVAERLRILARLDQLLNTDGTNHRVSAAAIAATSKCSATQAAGEIALARKLADLPQISEALANGDVTAGQISAVAAIASPGDETRALELAKTATSATLEREAAARRKDLFELRQQAHAKRFVTFKPSEDNASMTLIARGPWIDTDLMKQRLEKMAAQLEKGAGTSKSSFSARMYDALLNLARADNPSSAPASASAAPASATGTASSPAPSPATATPDTAPASATGGTSPRLVSPRLVARRIYARNPCPTSGHVTVIDNEPCADSDLCPIDDDNGSAANDDIATELYEYVDYDFSNVTVGDFETATPMRRTREAHDARSGNEPDDARSHDARSDDARFEGGDEYSDEYSDQLNFDDPDEPFPHTPNPSVIVTRANTKIVVHYDAKTGIVNYQNGPPIDHQRLTALLCDAALEVIHYDNGSPNGIVTTQRTKTDRQSRYLAHRDGPCRVPECPAIGHTHAHHLTWASVVPDRTETGGLINLCNYHHNQHHDNQLHITGDAERTITFTWTNGQTATATTTNRNRN